MEGGKRKGQKKLRTPSPLDQVGKDQDLPQLQSIPIKSSIWEEAAPSLLDQRLQAPCLLAVALVSTLPDPNQLQLKPIEILLNLRRIELQLRRNLLHD